MPAKPGAEPIMSRDEMKPLLLLSKREPVSCAVGLTRDKQGTLLLHRKTKPRKLLAELKRQAVAAGLELDAASLRFGRANVDASDAGTVKFTLNKAAPAALRMKLVEQLRPAGFQKCELVVDGALESEPDEDGPGDASEEQAVPRQADAAAAGPGLSPSGLNAPGGTDTSAQAASGSSDAAPVSAPDAAPESAPGAAPDAARDAAPGAALGGVGMQGGGPGALRGRLTGLVRRVADAVAADPAGANPLKAAAIQAREALRSGDLTGAGRGADALERLLGGGTGEANPDGTGAAGTADNTADSAAGDAMAQAGEGDAAPLPGRAAGGAAPDGAPPPSDPSTVGPDAASPGRPAPGKPRHAAGSPLFAKGRDAWAQVHTKLSADMAAAGKALAARAGHGTDMAREVEEFIKPIMAGLDDKLAHKLDEVAKASDPSSHARHVQDAVSILDRYKAFAQGNEAMAHLDKNPIHPVAIGLTLTTALAALEKVVRTSDGTGAGGTAGMDAADARAA